MNEVQLHGQQITDGIIQIIEDARKRVAIYVNKETTLLYWEIGNYINREILLHNRAQYGTSIVATVSQQLSWSHLIELSCIEDDLKRDFFMQLSTYEKWGVRQLRDKIDTMLFERTAIASQPQETIKTELQKLTENKAKNDMQQGEESPIGQLLCSEGNTEHIELLMLDEKDIKVAQYLTELPSKQWFADKLHRALEIAKMNKEL